MTYAAFTEQEFKTGLARLGEDDVRKLLRGGALDGQEARWATEWLASGAPAVQVNETPYVSYALAS